MRKALLLLAVSAAQSLAQESRGAILGRVTDASGTAVAGVAVQVINRDTEIAASLLSNEQGMYHAPFLNPGIYRITASAQGFKLNASYTLSKFMEAISFLNETDAKSNRGISDQDRTHRVSSSFIFELPFGRGRALWSGARGVPGAVVSGWQCQGIFVRQSGQPLAWGNVLFRGDVADIPLSTGQTVDRWFNTGAGFERDTRNQLQWNYRTFPLRLSGARGPGANNWDLSLIKNTNVREGMRFQFRLEMLNAMNRSWFSDPNVDPYSTAFGTIAALRGYARRVQAGLKFMY